ncbi:APC family permease [Paraliomyxa miuraensis]|uniref:APC family permease n=1 Tax=Paraliomyxa miuraensis TaxID=376150 RepID=UPI002254282B|nr:amino acid permease [Paraliomyxa miuraensis]MCX4242165.1 amino acid permease [Paraliomyxa miuraensis]
MAAVSLVAGSMLGIGIFIAPPVVAGQLDHPGTFLLMWLAGGLSALFGALAVAELGAMMPRAGGDYPYLRIAYGPGIAFGVGWLQLLAIFPGSLATMAVGTSSFQLPVILGRWYTLPADLGLSPEIAWALAIIVGLTALNHVGVVLSGRFQVVLTGIPVLVLLAASVGVLVSRGVEGGAWGSQGPMHAPGLEAAALAFLPVYFAYSGWNAAIFVGGEIRNPARNLPRALVGGTLGVTLLYFVLCVGFLAVFPMADLARVGEAGTAAARTLFGALGEVGVTTLIVLAMLGSINGTVLTGSRIAYAMARHGHCIKPAGTLHARFRTPVVALWIQAAWSMVLVLTQSFEQLMNYTSAAMLITGTLTVMAVMILRRKMPDTTRPYRAWGYPVTPILYAVSSLVVLTVLARSLDPSLFLGAGWFLGALLVHHLFMRKRAPVPDSMKATVQTGPVAMASSPDT